MNIEPFLNLILNLVALLVIPFCVYIVRKLASLELQILAIKVVLIGYDGENGLRSRVRRLERHFNLHEEDHKDDVR